MRTNADLLRFLPQGDAIIFFANIGPLRHAGMLNLLAGVKETEDREYSAFVRETHFDYKRDVEGIAGAVDGDRFFFVVRGYFDWNQLRQYAIKRGAVCGGNTCKMATGTAGRRASFFPIQPDVLALAFASDASAAAVLKPPGHAISESLPSHPVWMRVSQSLMKNPASLPPALRIFAISVQSANLVMLSLGPTEENSGAAFNLRLDASCPSQATAGTIRNQLEIQTKMLRLELTRERQRPNPADLTGLLTSGSFQVVGNTVIGIWPVSRELLRSLQ